MEECVPFLAGRAMEFTIAVFGIKAKKAHEGDR
jgi:hypothetical protein